MGFGEKIKKLRIEKNWTQEYVAGKLLISVGALSRYETGMYEPKSLDLIKDFANLFSVTTDFLLGKDDNPNIVQGYNFAYHKEGEGLSAEEIEEALKLYKQIKYGDIGKKAEKK